MKYLLVMGCNSRLRNAFFYTMTIQGLAVYSARPVWFSNTYIITIYIGRSYKRIDVSARVSIQRYPTNSGNKKGIKVAYLKHLFAWLLFCLRRSM